MGRRDLQCLGIRFHEACQALVARWEPQVTVEGDHQCQCLGRRVLHGFLDLWPSPSLQAQLQCERLLLLRPSLQLRVQRLQ